VDKEGGFHKIALKANKDDLTVVTREGYYAPRASAPPRRAGEAGALDV
jgi:hypothetical protein